MLMIYFWNKPAGKCLAGAAIAACLYLGGGLPPATAQAESGNKMAATTPARETGPRLSDAQLFDALALDGKGLEAVRAAVAAGDLEQAKHALASYLRERRNVLWSFDPHQIDKNVGHNQAAADKTVHGDVSVVTIWHTFPNSDIDWFYNETKARPDLPDNNEWQWQLNRMGFWGDLGRTYWATGNEEYARTFVKHLRSWVHQCPVPAKNANTADSAWRTIECGIRMAYNWPDTYYRFLLSPSFTDADVILYLKCCVEHARYLAQYPTGGNWLTMEMSGLYTVGAVFPELKEAAAWRKQAAQTLYAEADKQFLPDGAQFELTPGYHQVALDNILNLYLLAQRFHREQELPADYIARLEKTFDYNLFLMTPNRSLPTYNDSWPVGVPNTLRRPATLFPNRKDYAWVASDGKQGEPPATTSHAFPYAGYYAMRSGWEKDANYLCFDAGPLGNGHYHQDKLNLTIWGYGREILFDGGGGSYESSRWRSYGVDTFSHNTVLVDGQPQRRDGRNPQERVSAQPLNGHWVSTPVYDYAAGSYSSGYGKVDTRLATHARRVLFLKPDLFLVADTLTPNDAAAHTYQARWHLLTTNTTRDAATGAVTTADAGKPNLVIIPLLGQGLETRVASAQTEPELLGWWVRKDTDPQYVPATTVLNTRQGTGVQQFLTLLLPL
ncbi:MAG TPA: alginate lyase family protein, partial [Armatimonadota bacterium]|nr:alginate lyase family protein [Armatimonadota bacterium]